MGVSDLSCCRRIRGQFDRLSRELSEVAAVAINKKKPLRVSPCHHVTGNSGPQSSSLHTQHSRSLPAIGIKPMAKKRPSLFNIVDHANADNSGESPAEGGAGYQLHTDAPHVPGLAVAKGIEVHTEPKACPLQSVNIPLTLGAHHPWRCPGCWDNGLIGAALAAYCRAPSRCK